MKKGLINMISLVLTLVTLILVGLMAFVLIPQLKASNDVITRIATILDLDAAAQDDGEETLSVDKIAVHSIEEKMTITLADDGSGTPHYAVAYVSVYFNKENENFETYNADVATQEPMMKSFVSEVISKYTADQLSGEDKEKNINKITEEIKNKLNDMYGTDLVYKVVFPSSLLIS